MGSVRNWVQPALRIMLALCSAGGVYLARPALAQSVGATPANTQSVGADEALPIDQLAPKLLRTVLRIVVANGRANRYGSAVQVDPDLAVTNCHVIGDARTAEVFQGQMVQAEVVAIDRRLDLCLLYLKAGNRPIAERAPSTSPGVGAAVLAIGHSYGRPGLSRGCVLQRFSMEGGNVLRTSARFDNGASGGGLFDDRGRLLGILTFFHRSAPPRVAPPSADPDAAAPATDTEVQNASASADNADADAYLSAPVAWVWDLVAQWRSSGALLVRNESSSPFWDLYTPETPWFLQALALELSGRWQELERAAQGRLQFNPEDEHASAALELAHLRLRGQRPVVPCPAGISARPAMPAIISSQLSP